MLVGFKDEPEHNRLVITVDGQDVVTVHPLWTAEATPSMIDEASAEVLIGAIVFAFTDDNTLVGEVTSERQLEFLEGCAARLLAVTDRARARQTNAIESLIKLRNELG